MVDLCSARLVASRNGVAESTLCLEPQPDRLPDDITLAAWQLATVLHHARCPFPHDAPLSEVACRY